MADLPAPRQTNQSAVPASGDTWHRFLARVLLVVSVVTLAAVLLLVLWFGIHAVLLGVAGLLLAVFLYRLSELLARRVGMPYGGALAVVCLVLLSLTAGAVWLTQARLAAQLGELSDQLPRAWQAIIDWLGAQGWGRWVLARSQEGTEAVLEGQTLVSSGLGVLQTTGQVLGEVFVVLFIGLFGAIAPQLYVRGAIRLVPPAQRGRAQEVLSASGDLLWWWLLGQFIAMAFIGIVTLIVLWALGVPLALTLALIAAVLNFIPNFGPVVATVPAAMLALLQGPLTALWVIIIYLLIQLVQNHVVEPLVQQKAVELPPVILILAQVFMYYWAGILGMALAPPLAAVAMHVVQMLYVHDELGDPMEQDKGFWAESDTKRAGGRREG